MGLNLIMGIYRLNCVMRGNGENGEQEDVKLFSYEIEWNNSSFKCY